MKASIASLALFAVLVPALATAQTTPEGPGKVQQIRAVERGGFVETDIGLGMFLKAPGDGSYGLSVVTGVYAGYDVLPVLSVALGVLAMGTPATLDVSRTEMVGGMPVTRVDHRAQDLFLLSPMVQVQLALVTTERNFLYVRAAAGFGFALPETLGTKDYGGLGPVFGGTVGFERYTKLRHFSIGVQAGALVVTKPDVGIGLTITPTLKYTF